MSPPSPETKLAKLRALLCADKNEDAIKLAASWGRLPPEHKSAILAGREAVLRPSFQRSLGHDPDVQIRAAVNALRTAYLTPARPVKQDQDPK